MYFSKLPTKNILPSSFHIDGYSIPKNTPNGKSESPITSRTDTGGGACGITISLKSITGKKQIGGNIQIFWTHLNNEGKG